MRLAHTLLVFTLLASSAAAQIVVVRDTISPLPPFSPCGDGATHITDCTQLRLRPNGNNLNLGFVAVEITGTMGMVTCPFVDVTSVRILDRHHFTTVHLAPLGLDFVLHGTGDPRADTYFTFVDAGFFLNPIQLPPFSVWHLTPRALFLGAFAPQGLNAGYAHVLVPPDPLLRGMTVYLQAFVLDAGRNIDISNLDCVTIP